MAPSPSSGPGIPTAVRPSSADKLPTLFDNANILLVASESNDHGAARDHLEATTSLQVLQRSSSQST